jgi:hypothetical protein
VRLEVGELRAPIQPITTTRPYLPRRLAIESMVESFTITSAFEPLRNAVIGDILP